MSPPQAQRSFIPCSLVVPMVIASSVVQLLGFGLAMDESFVNCGNASCGNMNVTYPLWIAGREDYCGHPSYELECQGDNLVATILSHKYRVLDMVWEKQSLIIVRIDLLENTCAQEQGGFVLDHSLFNYTTGDLNATVLYNCSSQSLPGYYNFNCSMGNDRQANLLGTSWATSSDYPNDSGQPACSGNMTVPVMKSSISDLLRGATTDADQVLKDGFEVRWTLDVEECRRCISSGGRCGTNTTTEKFNCFCPSGTYELECPVLTQGIVPAYDQAPAPEGPSSKKNVGLKVGIGVASGGGVFLILITVFLCHRYRNRRKPGHSYTVSRSFTSAFSSRTDLEKSDLYYGLPIFDYNELQEATNNFNPQKELGEGGFGTVFHGKLRDGRSVAVKRLYENNYKRVEQFMNEVEILARLRHPNLVILYGCTSRQSHRLLLVYEYVPNGTVADHLHGDQAKPGSLRWSTRLNIAIETASALVYLHASDIIHRDVKTNNILLDENFSVKVADFGLSRLFPFNVTHVSTAPQGTPGYVDPEYHQCYQLTEKSDVYSFGVVLMELISSLPAVDITRHRHEINLSTMAINKIHNHALHELVDPHLGFDLNCDTRMMITAVAELGFQCLQSAKDMRPSMAEVLTTLKDIRKQGTDGNKKAEEKDDAALLKANPPSPDSVMAKFLSTSTTPNASG